VPHEMMRRVFCNMVRIPNSKPLPPNLWVKQHSNRREAA
jgi:hypothetical protein